MEKSHIKKGDLIEVISGKQKGFVGIVKNIIKKKSSVILEGGLSRIKYQKQTEKKENLENPKVELPSLVHISNVMLIDKTTNQKGRIGYKMIISSSSEKLEKKRYFKKSGNLVS